ncbi:hypothetical protein GF323_00755 [Candidatus Woesearchaeota archaeon]|nr:hypothetical protein [Candidatus Woesearchaeota archaeon]
MKADKFLAWIVAALIVSGMCLAIGVSPVRKVVDFEPNKEYELELKISNDGQKDIKALVYSHGELTEYIGIVDSLVSIGKDEETKARFRLGLPASLDKPGIHKAEMVVMEYPSSYGTEKETVVLATASVVSELWVRVPYPGKYAEARLYIDAKNTGEDVNFAVALMNFGKEDIQKAKAVIRILGATYEEIGVIETNEAGIKTGGQEKLTASWPADVNPGKYHVIAEITYDGKKLILEDNFEVGNLLIDIKKISVKDFSLGDVAVFDILLESKWNEQINNVYGEMTVMDRQGTEYTKFKTASIDMPAMGEGTLKAYWDTENAKVGQYSLRLLIHYAEKVTEKLIEAEVNIDSIRTELGATAQVVAQEGMGRDTLLTILVIILIIINAAWFAYFIKSRKK